MRFLADVNVSREVVRLLRAYGLDVTRASEVMDARSRDEDVLEEARRRAAVLISHDQDFSAILAVSGATGPSLINIRVFYVEAARLAGAIVAAVRATQQDLLAGAIVTLDDAGVRVHLLPLA